MRCASCDAEIDKEGYCTNDQCEHYTKSNPPPFPPDDEDKTFVKQ